MTDATLPGLTRIRVLDFETTGTQEDADAEVIEMGRIDLDPATGLISNSWETFCRPQNGIPPVTRAVHHITDAEVEPAPPARECWDQLFADLGDGDPVCAHNNKFELAFVPPDYRDRPWICTYKVALVAWPDAPGHSNQVLRYWLGIDKLPDFSPALAQPPHRALPDSYVTAFILRELLKFKTIPEMLTISSYPAVLRKVSFGKHRGQRYSEVPSDFLEWMLTTDMDEDRKFTARRELQIRRKAGK